MAGTKLSDRDQKYLDVNFVYHAPTPKTIPLYLALRAAGKFVARMILTTLPESRERSTALTHLETAIFWANAAVARNSDRLPNVKVDLDESNPDFPSIELSPVEPEPAAPVAAEAKA